MRLLTLFDNKTVVQLHAMLKPDARETSTETPQLPLGARALNLGRDLDHPHIKALFHRIHLGSLVCSIVSSQRRLQRYSLDELL